MSDVTLSPLRVARRLRGLTASELAKRVNRTGALISQIESGKKDLSEESALLFAAALGVSLAFLFRAPMENTAKVVHFRHLRRTPAWQRDRVHSRALLLGLLVRELESSFGELAKPDLIKVDLPGRPGDPGRMEMIEQAAADLRRHWGLGLGPVPDVIRQVEARGLWVITLPPEDRAISAFSWWGDGQAFIALNPVPLDGSDALVDGEPRNAYRERFNVMHEVGHLCAHDDLHPDDIGSMDVENEAHRFAAAFLVPASTWLSQRIRSVNWHAYKEAAQFWGVSASALVRRNYDLGLLSDQAYRSAMIRMSNEIGRRAEGAHLPTRFHETPVRLLGHLRALHDAGVSLEDLADRLSVNADDLRVLATDIPVVPVTPVRKAGDIVAFDETKRRKTGT